MRVLTFDREVCQTESEVEASMGRRSRRLRQFDTTRAARIACQEGRDSDFSSLCIATESTQQEAVMVF